MRIDDRQVGSPYVEYKDTKANIEALTGVSEGAIAYATDTDQIGTYDGVEWDWIFYTPEYSTKWFVSSEIGDDENTGLNETESLATIDKALENCIEYDLIDVLDSNTYTLTSTIIIPDNVTVNMPFAELKGEINLGNNSRFIAKKHTPSDDGQTMVSCIGTLGSVYTVYGMSSVGYSNIIHFKPAAVGGYVVANARHITVGSSTIGNENILVYSTAGSTGVNIATDGAKFSSDKALNYGYPADLVYGDTGYAQWYTDVVGYPITITYDIGTGTTVSSYKMKATSSGTRMPKNWTVYGQLADAGWELLDTQEDITWDSYEEKEFDIVTPDSYDEYKIVIASSTHATRLQIDDIGLIAGVASVGGDIMVISDILSLGEYAQGILSHAASQRVITNINNIYQISGTSNATFIAMSNGTVSHSGGVVTADIIWNKTGGVLIWNVAFDNGDKTGSATLEIVNTMDAQTIAGVKTFSSFPITPSEAPDEDYEVANKKYVDDNLGTTIEKNDVEVATGVVTVNFEGAAIVTDEGGNKVTVTVSGGEGVTYLGDYIADPSGVYPNEGDEYFYTKDEKVQIYISGEWNELNGNDRLQFTTGDIFEFTDEFYYQFSEPTYDQWAVESYNHISSNGSSHSYINQNVTSGSSPTFDGTNFSNIDADSIKGIAVDNTDIANSKVLTYNSTSGKLEYEYQISGVTDHGVLTGLGDDDHTQYLLASGSRALAGAWNMNSKALTNVNIDSGTIDNAVTHTEWDAAYSHISSNGSSHSYIDQDVTNGASPTFDGANFTGIDHGALDGLSDNDHTQYVLRQPTANTVINNSVGDYDFIIHGNATYNVFYLNAGTPGVCIGATTPRTMFTVADDITPYSTGTYNCGTSSYKWYSVYATVGTIQTSDASKKESIETSDLGLDFILKLNPVSYKFKDQIQPFFENITIIKEDGQEITERIEKERIKSFPEKHYGLLAQEIETSLNGKEFSGIVKEGGEYGLNYSELISPIIKAIQEQQDIISNQQEQINDLVKRIEKLEAVK